MRGIFLSDRVINPLHFLSLWVFPWVSLSAAVTVAEEKAKAVTQQRDLNSPECSPNSDEPLTWIGGYSEHRGSIGLVCYKVNLGVRFCCSPNHLEPPEIRCSWVVRKVLPPWLLPALSPASPIRRRRKITIWQRQFSALTGAEAETCPFCV